MEKLGNLIIIRGLCGSGKSTKAKQIVENMASIGEDVLHVEADMYFIDIRGEYIFNARDLGKAHSWCKSKVENALLNGYDVVVSNTFTTIKELIPYLAMECTTLAIFECHENYGSIHGVPQEALNRMANRWQELPDKYKEFLK